MSGSQPTVVRVGGQQPTQPDMMKARAAGREYNTERVSVVDPETGYGQEGSNCVLPRVSKEGGIRGQSNPYGQIAAGEIQVNNKTIDQPSVIPAHITEHSTSKRGKRSPMMESLEALEEEIEANDTEDEEVEAEEETTDWSQAYKERQNNTPSISEVIEAYKSGALEEKIKKRTRVRLSGTFGNYRGMYSEVLIAPQTVCLLAHDDDSMFCPQASADAVTIEIQGEKESYDVMFAGLEIDLPFCELVMQVYIRADKNS
jgi:hypothetical protein